MTILTGVVLTIALGAVAQRGDFFDNIGMGPGLEPRDDMVALEAGGGYLIDVVANDRGARAGDGGRILVMTAPACGAAYRRDGRIFYQGGAACEGVQRLSYCVARGDDCPGAEVSLRVVARGADLPALAGAPVERLEAQRAPAVAFADVSIAPPDSGFTAEPLLGGNGGALAGLVSAFGSLAPSMGSPEVR